MDYLYDVHNLFVCRPSSGEEKGGYTRSLSMSLWDVVMNGGGGEGTVEVSNNMEVMMDKNPPYISE